jgi:hypothetical protein
MEDPRAAFAEIEFDPVRRDLLRKIKAGKGLLQQAESIPLWDLSNKRSRKDSRRSLGMSGAAFSLCVANTVIHHWSFISSQAMMVSRPDARLMRGRQELYSFQSIKVSSPPCCPSAVCCFEREERCCGRFAINIYFIFSLAKINGPTV